MAHLGHEAVARTISLEALLTALVSAGEIGGAAWHNGGAGTIPRRERCADLG